MAIDTLSLMSDYWPSSQPPAHSLPHVLRKPTHLLMPPLMPRLYCSKMSRGPFPSAIFQAGITKLCTAAFVGIAVTHCVGLLAVTNHKIPAFDHKYTCASRGHISFYLNGKATPLTPGAGSFLLFALLLLISHPLNKQLL